MAILNMNSSRKVAWVGTICAAVARVCSSLKLEPEVPKMYRLHWSTASIFNVPCMYIAYGFDPCCMCPENQSELWLCLNLRSFPMIL